MSGGKVRIAGAPTPIKGSECSVVFLKAPLTTVGNPRRVYLVIHPEYGLVAAVKDDGTGSSVLAPLGISRVVDVSVKVSATEYLENVQTGKKLLTRYAVGP